MAKPVGPWAVDKLGRLGKYLDAYTQILHGQSWCKGFYYIDAFAGPGSHRVRPKKKKATRRHPLLKVADYAEAEPQVNEFIDGSPRVALGLAHPFTAYVFVDKNRRRVAELQKLEQE